MKKIVCVCLVAVLFLFCTLPAFAATDAESLRGTTLKVLNWGEYISSAVDGNLDVNKAFEEKYGIQVVYDTFDNNESMYAKLKGGGVSYDVVIPSDYMIGRMITEDMLEKLDFSNIPNYSNIAEDYKNLAYDPDNAYSVPYNVGMVGLIYNTKMVTEAPTSWAALWDTDYTNKTCMINNPRDSFAIAQALLGQDFNTENLTEWEAAAQKLKEQRAVKPVYVSDEVFQKMESGEMAFAPYYAGDFLSMQEVNSDLAFVYPKEGVNEFVDAACVLKGSQNKAAAELYINFLLDPEIALANAEYLCYASPNTAVRENPEYSLKDEELLYPSENNKPKTQIFQNLSPTILNKMNSLWEEVKANSGTNTADPTTQSNAANTESNGENGAFNLSSKLSSLSDTQKMLLGLCAVVLIAVVYLIFRTVRKKRREG